MVQNKGSWKRDINLDFHNKIVFFWFPQTVVESRAEVVACNGVRDSKESNCMSQRFRTHASVLSLIPSVRFTKSISTE